MLPDDDSMVGSSISSQGNKRPAHTASKSPPAKRAKLSEEERAAKELEREQRKKKQEEKRQEIEQKKRIKEEERQLKDEERRVREEEKRAKNEERKLKEEERQKKEDEKRTKKEAEDELKRLAAAAIEKKERSQLRMGNFFKKVDPKPVAILQTAQTTLFKPFYVKENARLADICVKSKTPLQDFEQLLGGHASSCSITFHKDRSRRRKSRRERYASLRSRLQQVTSIPLEDRLRDVNYRLLQFSSDIRPAYFGTMTADPEVPGLRTGRNPFQRTPKLNYEYDSELDWIEGDEEDIGEDLASDDEASVISRDTYGEDDDDFLDDEEVVESQSQRRQGHLIPIIQGMYHPENDKVVQHMMLQKLIEVSGPIDPFFDYWEDKSKIAKVLTDVKTVNNQLIPQPIPKLLKKASTNGETTPIFPENLLPEFKQAIDGSTLKKAILVEKLRTDFAGHKLTKKVIESKLNEIAIRKGRGQNDSWTLL